MDPHGRLTITKDGKETFKGETFEETGVANELQSEFPANRKERRRMDAENRRIAKRLAAEITKP